jgi:transcriptional regulator with XRE-family HTH domain
MGINGDKLYKLRVSRGLTMTALAQRAGVSVSLISYIEQGKTAGSPTSARKLADALSSEGQPVTVDDIWNYC